METGQGGEGKSKKQKKKKQKTERNMKREDFLGSPAQGLISEMYKEG